MIERMKTYIVFVYGTLRKGGLYHDALLKEARLVAQLYRLTGYRLYDYRQWYPYMVKGAPEDAVMGEVYEVDATTLEKLNVLEEVEQEVYRLVYLPEHQFFTYLKFDEDVTGLNYIAGGDWLQHLQQLRKGQ